MTRFGPTDELRALRERFPARTGPRVLLHRGTCGDAVDATAAGEALRAALGDRAGLIVESACDGACWAAPAATVVRDAHVHRHARLDESGPETLIACLDGDCDAEGYSGAGARGLMARVGRNDGSLADVLAMGSYGALAHALVSAPEATIGAIDAIKLTGRGGAHFPVPTKWKLVAAHGGEKVLLVNAEEGEPGVFKDRHMLEGDPHRLLEGILMCCHATGANRVVVYINGQARNARTAFEAALVAARAAGIVDGSAFGRALDVEIDVRSGAGGYVCGEESVIMNSVEGERPVPRFKPPYATDVGVFGRPTVINNCETLCVVTTVFDESPPPTKLIPLSGAIPRPGLYEVPIDGATTWAGVLAMAGANPQRVSAVLLGGPSGTFVTPARFDDPLDMRGLGAGGAVVLPADADIARITRELTAYNMRESCGECTPCREGTARMLQLLDDPAANRTRIDELIEVLTEASLCQLGGMAGRPVASALAEFPEAFA